jgi:glycosyltransferase involved in cell wall biosynthesis
MKQVTPRVSIGLPVYNGEKYLVEAIDSILGQTYEDFELIICDNASTDRTAKICEDYAACDARIRYYRNPTNIGGGPNFDRTFELSSRGEYFRWAAHDDVVAPTFLERCVSALDADPDAVLCQSLVELIDFKGEVTDIYDPKLTGTWSTRASDRFAAIVLQMHMSTDCFAVIRRSALEGSPLNGNYPSSDQVLLAVLALRGRYIQIREPLFQNRSYPERYSEALAYDERSTWMDSSTAGKTKYPLWRQYAEYVREVRRHDLSPGDRLRCYGHLAHWWFVNWNIPRMAVDIIAGHYPQADPIAHRVKHRIFGRNNLGFNWERWQGADKS